MSDIIRGKRKGLFTFTQSDHGPDVCMSYETYKKLKDDALWGTVLYTNMIMISNLLEQPIRDGEVAEAHSLANESISRPVERKGEGFVDRRSDVIDVSGL